MELFIYFIAIVLMVLSLLTIINVLTFPRLHKTRQNTSNPFVSILIPARNEATVIQKTVTHILSQSHRNFELLILDDNSTDETRQLLDAINDERLKIIQGASLPPGWVGKSWACHQLSQHATGDILIFTDADVIWTADALIAVVTQMQQHDADLFTVWSTQETITPAERLTVPLMAFAILTYLPTFMTHYSPFSVFAAANGQCMAWKQSTYAAMGGHTIVANTVLDDVNFARHVKKAGFKLRMADGNKLIRCRMYNSWQAVRDGFAKNILAGYGNSVLGLSISIVFHFVIFLLPIFLMIIPSGYQIWAAIFVVQAILIRALSASFTHQRIVDSIAMPISVILMTIIAIQSVLWHYTGGPRWKGRILRTQSVHEAQANG